MQRRTTVTTTAPSSEPAFFVRRSQLHGRGLFAKRPIAKGERIVEYIGERISHAEADRRAAKRNPNDPHTFFFTLTSRTIIDARVGGNAARFANHSCKPNCEVQDVRGRLFIHAERAIKAGEELVYDYWLSIGDETDDDNIYACRCGARGCRGTMLAPVKKKPAAKTKRAASPRSKTKTRSKAKTNAKTKSTTRAKAKRTSRV